jgi:hypothetical protein
MKTYMLWTMEWPAWGWLIQGNGVAVRRPADHYDLHSLSGNRDAVGKEMVLGEYRKVGGLWARNNVTGTVFEGALDRVPCAGSGPLNLDLRNRAYRDCSEPDLSVTEALPWITKDTAATAIAELANPKLQLVEQRDPGARWPGYVAAGLTGALAIATVASYLKFSRHQDVVAESAFLATIDPMAYEAALDKQKRWGTITLGLTAASVVSVGATLLLWNRNAPKSSFSVQPTEKGGAAAFTKTW